MQKALTLTDQQAVSFYPSAPPMWKMALENTWGKEFFSQKITDRIKTVEDACSATGLDYYAFMKTLINLEPDTAAYEQMKVVVRALNEGWTPDWNNDSQRKWYPWFRMYTNDKNPSGFGLHAADFDLSHSTVGSRLVFKSEELAKHAAIQFEGLYRTFFHF